MHGADPNSCLAIDIAPGVLYTTTLRKVLLPKWP